MKNQLKFEKFRKYIEKFDFFFTSIFILLPFFTIVIFCPEILHVERYNLYLYKTFKGWYLIQSGKNVFLVLGIRSWNYWKTVYPKWNLNVFLAILEKNGSKM